MPTHMKIEAEFSMVCCFVILESSGYDTDANLINDVDVMTAVSFFFFNVFTIVFQSFALALCCFG